EAWAVARGRCRRRGRAERGRPNPAYEVCPGRGADQCRPGNPAIPWGYRPLPVAGARPGQLELAEDGPGGPLGRGARGRPQGPERGGPGPRGELAGQVQWRIPGG